ncbi:MAG: RagB/SusD family nutrient uptake outer membrane protein [Chitinophagaceae bacterium]|nr:RagB/SusD family nutrient uptake outer membrane protein [Chitinophagaceae bacterium]
MKPNNYYIYIALFSVLLATTSGCNKNLEPYNSKSDATALLTASDLQTATYGVYALIKTHVFLRAFWWMQIFPGDDVALSGNTSNPIYNSYTYTHFPTMANAEQAWQGAYAAIYAANRIIERIEDGESAALDQIKGENRYLRGLLHFILVRFFGRPYVQGNGDNPGIPIMDSPANGMPSRSSVKKTYEFIVDDLLKAADLMTQNKKASFATKEAAYALLSRVYLYMGDDEKAILYANKVFDSNRYQLVDTEPYKKYFTVIPENNPETIFAIRNTVADDQGKQGIGTQFYNDPVTQVTGYGETYASLTYLDILDKYPEDVRHSFIEPQKDANGNMLTRGGVPKYFVNKYNWQEGVANLCSPVISRLAEIYLNRAEAYAKLGEDELALQDVNTIRERAGLSGVALYTVDDLKGHASVLDVVLEERRLELAFEGQRYFDLFRNNLPMVRKYPGFHGNDHFNQTVLPTDARVIYFVPEREITVNPNLTQNP